MHLNDDPHNLYDWLELTPDATPQEIRSAYLRLKAAYGKDNIAHYGAFNREETDTMLKNIEDAFLVLSNPEKRKLYDQNQGFTSAGDISVATQVAFPAKEAAPTPHSHSFGSADPTPNDIDQMIKAEVEWTGRALKRIREAKRISLEDLSDYTRISRVYLHALEEEDFAKLPATVYIRGFLQQVTKRLKIPTDLVTKQYIERVKLAQPNKA